MIKQTTNGVWVIANDTHFSKWVEESGRLDHDQYVIQLLLPKIDPGIVIDAGANIGTHTIVYCNVVGSSNVIAIEPNLECVKCLRKNVPYCNIIEAAIGDECGRGNLVLQDNVGASYMIDGDDIPIIKLDTCELVLLKSQTKRISFIKIDIEGYEVRALKGATQLISKHRPVMWIEVNRGALLRANTCEQELLDLIESFGYSWKAYPKQDIQYDILCNPH
jgi:FkbM family methyltransferase